MAAVSRPASIVDIAIAAITVPSGRRRLDPAWVETLAAMIEADGLQSAIEVVTEGEGYRLVFGAHRLAAVRQLGRETIPAVVKNRDEFTSEAQITLREITENLARRELSVLDRAVDIARWREIYEAAEGAVRRGRPAKLVQVAPISDEHVERFAASFSEAAQKALGLSRDAIKRALRIASIPADLRSWIALHPIADNQSELLQLAAEPEERQEHICGLLTSEPPAPVSVAAAIALIDETPAPPREPRWQQVSTAFSQLKETEQNRFFALHEAAITRWLKGRAS